MRCGVLVPGLVLFSLAFAIPLSLILSTGTPLTMVDRDRSPRHEPPPAEEAPVGGAVGSFRVVPGPAFNPAATGSYWIGVRVSLTRTDERQALLTKIDGTRPSKPGIQLILSPEGSRVRPQLYWKTSRDRGSWYYFSDVSLVPNEPYLFLVSFREGRYLSAHLLRSASKSVELLGGYDLAESIVPDAPTSLVVGRTRDLPSFGMFHEFFIVRDEDDSLEAATALRSFADGAALDSVVDRDSIQAWTTDFKVDKVRETVRYTPLGRQ